MCVFELHDWVTSSGERSASRMREEVGGRRDFDWRSGDRERRREKEGKQRKSHSFLPINPSSKESVLARCCRNLREIAKASVCHGCQIAIARFLYNMFLALRASGLWLRSATLQNLILSFPYIAPPRPPPWRNPRKKRDQILPSGNLGVCLRGRTPWPPTPPPPPPTRNAK